MKQYKFLLKPLFFIFNLVFATWLVLKIEKIKPSDFGEHQSIFETPQKPRVLNGADKHRLKTIAYEFKYGLIDSAGLSKKLDKLLEAPGVPQDKDLAETR